MQNQITKEISFYFYISTTPKSSRGLYQISQYKPRIDANLYQPRPHILLRNPKDAFRQKQYGPSQFQLTVPVVDKDEYHQITPYPNRLLADCSYRRNQ